MKNKILPTLVLVAICLVVGFSLAFINEITAPLIEAAQNAAANEALTKVFPNGTDFVEIDRSGYTLPDSITAAYKEGSGGYVIQATVTGYKPGLVIMCGIDKDGKIVGADYIASNETLSAEVGLGDRFVGKAESEMSIDIVAGSTAKLTTEAYYNAIADAFKAFTILNGGSADLRTPEQILQDNCNAALGTEGVKFTKWFMTEVIEGIDTFDAIYEAEDKSGRVFVKGESFIAIKADGTIIGETDESEKIIAINTIIAGSTLTDVEKPEGASRLVKKIQKTASGNYVFEASTQGYSSTQDIVIKVSISADGKIIDCLTVSHGESKGYGEACATDEYYKQYIGASGSDIVISASSPSYSHDYISPDCTDIGAIASSTFTTAGYQKAIKGAFTTFAILTTSSEGGDQ
ncbi:MAG: FMN-binding protein [Clostridia bacterium]|nr:FMN-binding protein [Clostridia bacterium]